MVSRLDDHLLYKNFENFFDNPLCGFIITTSAGKILRVNSRVMQLHGISGEDLAGKNFSDLLSIGGKIYYETHLGPLLKMQGYFDEIALEITSGNIMNLPVLINAFEKRDENGIAVFTCYTILKATDRRAYEENLNAARKTAENRLSTERELSHLREQFIAVLGHDLRNPLAAIKGGADILSDYSSLDETDMEVAHLIRRSAGRMSELIDNIVDFAQTRLGGGINLSKRRENLTPILLHVINELKVAWPERNIEVSVNLAENIECDPDRLSQLLSNLLAYAITHGLANTPVHVSASCSKNEFELSVINSGLPISPTELQKIFLPFTRNIAKTSQDGLGLGLFISSEIAKAHDGQLVVTSSEKETKFTFIMPLF